MDVFRRRLKLFLQGARQGVGVWILQNNATKYFTNLEEFLNSDQEIISNSKIDGQIFEDLYIKAVESSKGATTSIWNAEKNLFKLLNILSLEIDFGEIVETGVANGITTKSIMWALNSNNSKASLYSFDVLPETRYSYDGEGTWNFRLLKGRNKHRQLKSEVKDLNNIRLWIHDSDHSYKWQKFEYKLAFNSLPNGGILISDDIDTSSAWIEVVPKNFSSNFVIFDLRKFIGIAIK